MSDAIRLESPLVRFDLDKRAALGTNGAGVIVTERAFRGYLDLRGDASDPRFGDAVTSVVGAPPPRIANTVTDTEAATIGWLGPDEWLIITTGESLASMQAALETALTGVRSSVTDISGGQTELVLRGPAVRDVLAKGCPLDLHPKVFGHGQCAQTHLARAAVFIRPLEGESGYGLVFRRSFADYVWEWLEHAGRVLAVGIAT